MALKADHSQADSYDRSLMRSRWYPDGKGDEPLLLMCSTRELHLQYTYPR